MRRPRSDVILQVGEEDVGSRDQLEKHGIAFLASHIHEDPASESSELPLPT